MKTNWKEKLILTLAGIAVSYCFGSMVLNARVVSPLTAWRSTPFVFDRAELTAGLKDFEAIGENRLRATTSDPWIELTNIRGRVGVVRSVVYKVKPIVQKPSEADTVLTELYYADTEQDYRGIRRFTKTYESGKTVITLPDYVGPIDKLRLDLTVLDDMTLEVEEISLNAHALFSWPLFGGIFAVWLLVLFLEPRKRWGEG